MALAGFTQAVCPILVINLDRASVRLEHVRRELAAQGLSFERVRAIDSGEARDRRAETAVGSGNVLTYYAPLNDAEIACTLSHRAAWQQFLQSSDAAFALILEDDFALKGDIASVVSAVAASGLADWDLIKLWGKAGRRNRFVAVLSSGHTLVQERVISTRTVGQFVSRAGARKLLERTLPIRRPIDVQLQHWWELGLRVLSVEPSVVVDVGDQLAGGSFIRTHRHEAAAAKVRREVGRVVFRAGLFAWSAYHFARAR